MFENIKKKSGWFENKTCMNEHGKLVAKEHSELANRNKNKDTLRVPMCGAPLENTHMLCGHKKENGVDVNEIEKKDMRNKMAVELDNAKTDKVVGRKDDGNDLVDEKSDDEDN